MLKFSSNKQLKYLPLLITIIALIILAFVLRNFDLSTPKLPLGQGVEKVIDWAIIYLSPVLESIKLALTKVFVAIETFFLWVPWPLWVTLSGVLGWRLISIRTGLLVAGGLLIIQFVQLWTEALSTVALVGTSVFFIIIVSIPIGILAAKNNPFDAILRPILDAMQTIPGLVYLIPAIMLLGVGKVPAMFATMIFGAPPAIRLTNLAIRQVPAEVKEAALAFGCSSWQLLVKVEIPLGMRTIMAGINQSTMMSVSMVVIAAFIGAGGLGYSVLFALDRVKIGAGFEAGLAILAIAIVLDRLTQAFGQRK